ncbi:DMT family transporter [Prescottella sp. R16]|uniref:DMT family transporter n=1 Tax=Prescottella sp. R16 TaxID=3064529 RepID=UPI00272EB69F|nr:DMT family transporter [Prescottella sp. R16]
MSGPPVAAIGCALAAALLFACASVAQQSAAATVPHGRSLIGSLVRSPRWWAGVAGDGGGYLLQVVALALGSVLVVQPLLVSMLLFALPLSARFSGHRTTRRAWLSAGALTVSLTVFLIVGDPTEGAVDAPWAQWALPLTVVVVVLAAVTVAGLSPRLDAGGRALLLGAAAGGLYGVAVAFTKYVTGLVEHGVGAVAGAWQTYALLAAGAAGVYLQQRAFQVGPLPASLPAITIAEPVVAIVLGTTVLGERLRTSGGGVVVVAAAGVVMVAATIALSREQAPRRDGAGNAGTVSPVTRNT